LNVGRWLSRILKMPENRRLKVAEQLEAHAAIIRRTLSPVELSPSRKKWSPSEN
jgi:hypothetical protein